MNDDYLAVLAHEFAPGEGSFLESMYQLRWDKAAFTRLTDAMVACCRALDVPGTRPAGNAVEDLDSTPIPRWLADGFWYVSAGVREFTRQEAWKPITTQEQGYYDTAYERLYMLASWFFTGLCPYTDPSQDLAPM